MTESPTMVLPVHRMTPWFRVRVSTGERSIAVEHWQAMLGFIPLRKRRIEVPFAELSSFRVRTTVRAQCLLAAAVAVAAIFVVHPPVAAIVGLAIVGFHQFALGFPNSALRIVRTDSRVWTVRFCRDYAFDLTLAFEDAERRKEERLPSAA